LHPLSYWRKESDPELEPDPFVRGADPGPHQKVTDHQHWFDVGFKSSRALCEPCRSRGRNTRIRLFWTYVWLCVWRFSGRRLDSPSTGSAPIWRRIRRHDQPSLSLLELLLSMPAVGKSPFRIRLEQFLNKNSSLSNFLDRIIKNDLIFPLSFPQGILLLLIIIIFPLLTWVTSMPAVFFGLKPPFRKRLEQFLNKNSSLSNFFG